jgi:hypothetical protein
VRKARILGRRKLMHGAVTIPEMYTTFFLGELPENREGLEVNEGAWVEIPGDLSQWPEGTDAPEQTLCRSTADPKVYRLFKYDREIDRSQFIPTGMAYGGVYSREMWERFVEDLPHIKEFHAIKGHDRPGAMDEALRCIRGAR